VVKYTDQEFKLEEFVDNPSTESLLEKQIYGDIYYDQDSNNICLTNYTTDKSKIISVAF